MALIEKNTRKRQRFESLQQCRSLSTCVESEENPRKRICEDSKYRNVDIFSETMSQEVACPQESIHEELVWDMMKKLEEEIVPSSSREEGSVNKCGSNQICDFIGDNGDESESSSREVRKVEFEYKACDKDVQDLLWVSDSEHGNVQDLLWVSDSELGIPWSPQLDFSQAVSEYFEDYGFFECVEMERNLEHQLLLQKWWSNNNSEGCEMRDLISVQDCSLFPN